MANSSGDKDQSEIDAAFQEWLNAPCDYINAPDYHQRRLKLAFVAGRASLSATAGRRINDDRIRHIAAERFDMHTEGYRHCRKAIIAALDECAYVARPSEREELLKDREALLEMVEEIGELLNVSADPAEGRAKRIIAAVAALTSK